MLRPRSMDLLHLGLSIRTRTPDLLPSDALLEYFRPKSVDEGIDLLRSICSEVFKFVKGANIPIVGLVVQWCQYLNFYLFVH